MKKLVLTALLVASGAAHADLRWLTDSPTDTLYRSGQATYSDNNGLVATSWFSMFSKTTAESGRWLIQVHCDTGLIRTIRTVTYMNNLVDYNTPENWSAPWRNPIPGSFEARFRVACTSR